jgi:hypothetical protein
LQGFARKGKIFITAGKQQRSLRHCNIHRQLPERQDLCEKSPAFQAAVVVQLFSADCGLRLTCGYENIALSGKPANNLF